MTYYVTYWMDDTATVVTAEGLAERLATATARGCELVLTTATATEMHFTEYEIEG
jgi:hypothetical protein